MAKKLRGKAESIRRSKLSKEELGKENKARAKATGKALPQRGRSFEFAGKQRPKYKPGQTGTNSHYDAWKKANEGKPRKKIEVSKKRAPGADAAVQALKDKAAKKRAKGDKIVATHEKRMKNDPKYAADFEDKKSKRKPIIRRQYTQAKRANSTGPNASKPKSAAAKPSSTTKPKQSVKPTPKAKAKPTQTSFIKKRSATSKAKPTASKKRQFKGLKFS